ncbi:hypothetical protein GOBAR_DD10290 [Gossypium barbadense]|nr:hypothetical protein GOBAR_DD10290 [Gossypium barbadense]
MEEMIYGNESFKEKLMANVRSNGGVADPIVENDDLVLMEGNIRQKHGADSSGETIGNYLTVQPWSRDFSRQEQHPSKIVVWMRTLGKVIKVDYNTTALAMKEITKKGHKVCKRVEYKRSSTQVMEEWVESLSKELNVSTKALGLEVEHEVHMEAAPREFNSLGENDMLEDSVVGDQTQYGQDVV